MMYCVNFFSLGEQESKEPKEPKEPKPPPSSSSKKREEESEQESKEEEAISATGFLPGGAWPGRDPSS